MKKWLVCLCMLMAVALLASCGSQLNDTPTKQGDTDTAGFAGSDIVGTVNGEDVYRYEYEYYLNTYFNDYFSNYYESLLQYQGVDLLDELSSLDLLSDLEYYAWNSVIQASLIRQMAFGEYGLNLESSYYENLLLPDTALAIKTNRLYSMLRPYIENDARAAKTVNDDEAEEYYSLDPAAWDCIRVAHIIITPDQMISEAAEDGQDIEYDAADELAMKRANDIITKLKNGEDFADMAMQYSADGAAQFGGEMDLYFNSYGGGVSEESNFDPDFATGAFLLNNVGDFSLEPVRSSFGYHIIKLSDKKVGFAEVKEFVLASMLFLDDSELGEFFANKMQTLEANAVVECNIEFKYYVPLDDIPFDELMEDIPPES